MSVVSVSSPSPRFSPDDIPGLSLWLDATDSTTVTRTGSNVTAWEDKSGLQNRAVSRGGSPVYTSSGINGRPAVTFSNAPSMTGNLSITGTTVTGFLVVQGSQSGSGRGDQRILSCAASGQADWNSTARFLVGIQGGGNIVRYNRANTYIPQTTIVIGSPVLLSWLSDGTSNFIWEDGAPGDVAASVANGDAFSITNYALGNQYTATTETYNGLIGEVLVYTTPLSTAQRQQVEGYLGRKWGFVSLTGHPYRSGGPGILPTSISGLRLWLDAAGSSNFTFSSGTTISTWNDKSGNGRNATPATGAMSYVDASSAVLFVRSSSEFMTLPNNTIPVGSSSFSVFFVFSPTSTGFEIQLLTARSSGGSIWGIRSGNAGTGTLQTFWSGNNDIQTANLWTANARNMGSFFYQASGTRSLWVNGTMGTSDTPSSQTAITENNRIGTLGATAFNTFDGQFHELIIYESSLSATQRYLIEGYLANKWGFNLRLPGQSSPYTGLVVPMRSFVPTDIDGCSLWLDAADPSTITLSGNTVTVWADKSGNARNATPLGTGPTRGSSAVTFSGTQTMSGSATYLHSSNDGAWSAFAVFRPTSLAVGNPRILNYQGTPNNVAQFLYVESGTLTTLAWLSGGASLTQAFGGSIVSNTTYLVGAVNSASTLTAYRNGVSGTPVSHGALTTASNSTYVLGGMSSTDDRLTGDIYEVVVFSNALTTTQRLHMENYLADKWGLRGSMGGTAHPYRYGPPVGAPPVTSNLRLWIDAQDPSGYTLSGSNVTAVLDKSSNAWSLGTAANATLGSTRFNETYPSFYSTGPGLASNASFVFSQPLTVYFVGQSLNTWSSAFLFDSLNTSTRVVIYSGAVMFAGGEFAPSNNSESLSPHVLCATFNGASSSMVLNGTTTTGDVGSGAFNGIIISKSDGYRGHICELMIYSGAHTTAQVQQMMGYLAWKWGLPSKLQGVTSNYARIGRSLTPIFTPLQIPGATLWLDGADTATQTFSGSTLTQWADKSGAGYTMTTVAPNCSLPVRGTAINRLTTVGITSGSMGMKQPLVIDGIKNIFWVRRENGGNQGYQFYLGADSAADFHTGDQGQFAHGGISPQGIRDASLSLFLSGGVTTGTMSTTQFTSGGGTLNILSVSNMTGTTRVQGISYDRGNTGRSITCDWGELLLYTTAVPVTDIKRVEGYLAWKWGLVSYLPSNHPFKLVKP